MADPVSLTVAASVATQAAASTSAASAAAIAAASSAAASSAAIGSVVAGAAAAAGSFAISTFAIPAILGPTETQGPRIESVRGPSGSEGSPINICYGYRNRIGGTYIWLTDPAEKSEREEVAKDQFVTTYTYSGNLAIALCEGPISSVRMIWANGELQAHNLTFLGYGITYVADDVQIVSNQLSVVPIVGFLGLGTDMRIVSPSGGPDLSQFTILSGGFLKVSGFSNGANNDTSPGYLVRGSGSDGSGATWVDLFHTKASGLTEIPPVSESAGATVTLTRAKLIFSTTAFQFAPTIKLGSSSQTAPLEMQASLKFGAIGYRHTAFVSVLGMQLEEFGNRLPQFIFEVAKTSGPEPLEDIIEDILERAGVPSQFIDVSPLNGLHEVDGFTLPGPTSAAAALKPLMEAYNIIATEANGKLTFRARDAVTPIPINETDLAARTPGNAEPRKIVITDMADFDLPSEVNVQFFNAKASTGIPKPIQTASTRERRIDAPNESAMRVDLPIVMAESQARTIARRLLWLAWSQRQTIALSLPPSYIGIQEGDVLDVPVDGYNHRVFVKQVEIGHNYQVRVEGFIDESTAVSVEAGPTQDGEESEVGLYSPPLLAAGIADVGPLAESDVAKCGYYLGLCAADIEAQFVRATYYRANTSGGYSTGVARTSESRVGHTTTALPTTTNPAYWDLTGTVDVVLYHGSLGNATEEAVLNGSNWVLIGKEVIGYQTATLVDAPTNKYRLSNLLRGLRGTESKIGTHATNEAAVFLSPGESTFVALSEARYNKKEYYKAVAHGADIDDIPESNFTFGGGTFKPFAPVHVRGTRDGSNNLTITWQYRSRSLDVFFGVDPPPSDTPESYTVKIYRLGVLKRTITASTATASYTAANQTTDGYTPGDPVDVVVYSTYKGVAGWSTSVTI